MAISPTAQQRFATKYRVDVETGCWVWIASRSKKNKYGYGDYGRFWLGENGNRNKITAHRASWLLHNGVIGADLMVLHSCDNPPCVNPKHLFLGTAKDNAQDAKAKDRCYIQPRNKWCGRHHEMTGINIGLAFRPDGTQRRFCRTCRAMYAREYAKQWRLKHTVNRSAV